MLKKFFLLLFFLMLASMAFAEQSESKFSDLGHEDFIASVPETESCFSIEFLSNESGPELAPVISLHLGFLGNAENTAKINVFLNGTDLGEFNSKDLVSASEKDVSREGWLRFYGISKQLKPLNEINLLKACLTPEKNSPKITLYSDSKIGYYIASELGRKDSFEMFLEEAPVAGKDTTVNIVLRNYGPAEQEVSLSYRKEELELRTPWVRFVTGKSSFNGAVPACSDWNGIDCITPGEKIVSYVIRISRADPLQVLPAILSYENNFGEKIEKKESNRLYLDVKAPNVELVPSIRITKKEFFPGERIPIKVIVQNTGIVNAPKTILSVSSDSLELSNSSAQFVLSSHESTEFEFIASAKNEGTHKINCSLSIPDYKLKFNCEQAEIKVSKPMIPIELIGGALLLLVAIIVFVYFYYVKKSKG